MRLVRRIVAAAMLVAPVLVLRPPPAAAHPLGNFTVNTSATIVVRPERVELAYVVDMAEIPTFQELAGIGRDGDVPDGELATWATARARELLGGVSLTVDGAAVELALVSSSAELLDGQGGLSVLRLEVAYGGATPSSGHATFTDRNFRGRAGWREIVVTAAGGATASSDAPAESPSDVLRAYPRDLLSTPLHVTHASFAFAAARGVPAGLASAGGVRSSVETRGNVARPGTDGGLVGLLASADLSSPLLVLPLLVAFGLGALHALGPGHGKTLVAAYLVGGEGRLRHASAVGVAVALMHTASVLALGAAILVADRSFAPETTYPWLGVAAGGSATVLGGALLTRRLRARHDRGHAHNHPDDHTHPPTEDPRLTVRTIGSIALAGGILPSPAALLTLLAAVALGRVPLGLGLIGAFSLGLATALVAVGVVTVRVRDVVARRLSGRWRRVAPVGSAAAILTVGLVMTARGVLAL
jgi:ABC-type nickel/cobalt efflux system permease component RcnA